MSRHRSRHDPAARPPVASSRTSECLGTVLAALPTVNEPGTQPCGRRHRRGGRLRDTPDVRITGIRLDRLVLPLDPPFPAAWDPVPRRSFAATIVRVETDEGVVGIGSGDTMDGFEAFEHLFIGDDPLAIAHHVRVLETIDFHAGRYWPLEVALWDIIGQVADSRSRPCSVARPTGIPAYASCGMLLPPAARAESALRLRDEGFTRAQDPGRSAPARGGPRRRGGDPARGRRFDGDHGRPQPGLADGRRHDALARPGGGPRDRPPARRVRRPVAGGAAGRHGPARPGRAPGVGDRACASPVAR